MGGGGATGPGQDHGQLLRFLSDSSRMEVKRASLTCISQFFLLGLSKNPEQQQLLFIQLLSTNFLTGLGNPCMILAIATDAQLHKPTHFFPANLAFVYPQYVGQPPIRTQRSLTLAA